MRKPPGVLFDNRYFEHHITQPSLENANRIRSLYRILDGQDFSGKLAHYHPREAGIDDIEAVHSAFYLDQIREYANAYNPFAYDRDTYLMNQSLFTAALAAGGCMELADRIVAGEIDHGFALIRPPGHHAEPGRGMGFCVLNNVAITAEYLRKTYGMQRLLILDFDVHHGNGTQSIFYETDQVFYLSIHQEKLFPFTGAKTEIGIDRGRGFTINLPVPQQFADLEYMYLMGKVLGAVVEQYLPQMILVSAGYDGHRDDPISGILLTTDWFASVVELLKFLAHEACNDRLLLVLEGGYNPVSLQEGVLATLERLMQPGMRRPGIIHSERAVRVLENHPLHSYWTI